MSHLPANVDLISHVHPKGALYEPAPRQTAKTKGRRPARRATPAGHGRMGRRSNQPWNELEFDQFGLHATLAVKTTQALYYKAGKDRLLTIVLVRDVEGKRPDQMFYCTKLDWDGPADPLDLRLSLGDRMHLRKLQTIAGPGRPGQPAPQGRRADGADGAGAVQPDRGLVPPGRPSARCDSPIGRGIRTKEEPSFADMLTTLRRVSYEEKTDRLLPEQCRLKTWIAQLTELLSRAA